MTPFYEFRLIGFRDHIRRLRVVSRSEESARTTFERFYGIEPFLVAVTRIYLPVSEN